MSYLALVFTKAERAVIAACWKSGILDWSSDALQDVRRKIRLHHREIQDDSCCYCRKAFMQDHPLAVDIEHVLPKSRYRRQAISTVNLSVACKRCNMEIKGARRDFISGSLTFKNKTDVSTSTRYTFIHPNLDVYTDHINMIAVQVDGCTLRRYVIRPGSSKGAATVKFFQLRELEEDDLDEMQGGAGLDGTARARQIRAILGV